MAEVLTKPPGGEGMATTVLKAGTVVQFHGYPVRLLADVTVEASASGIAHVKREVEHYGEE